MLCQTAACSGVLAALRKLRADLQQSRQHRSPNHLHHIQQADAYTMTRTRTMWSPCSESIALCVHSSTTCISVAQSDLLSEIFCCRCKTLHNIIGLGSVLTCVALWTEAALWQIVPSHKCYICCSNKSEAALTQATTKQPNFVRSKTDQTSYSCS